MLRIYKVSIASVVFFRQVTMVSFIFMCMYQTFLTSNSIGDGTETRNLNNFSEFVHFFSDIWLWFNSSNFWLQSRVSIILIFDVSLQYGKPLTSTLTQEKVYMQGCKTYKRKFLFLLLITRKCNTVQPLLNDNLC